MMKGLLNRIKEKIMAMRRVIYFGLVGGLGTIINTGILYLLATVAGMNYLIASAIATQTAIVANFLCNNYLTFRDKNEQTKKSMWQRFLSFQTISLVALFGTMFLLWSFVTLFGQELLLVWNMAAIFIMFIVNYVLNAMFTWKQDESTSVKSQRDFSQRELSASSGDHKHQIIGILLAFLLVLSFHSSLVSADNGSLPAVVEENLLENLPTVAALADDNPKTTNDSADDASSNNAQDNEDIQQIDTQQVPEGSSGSNTTNTTDPALEESTGTHSSDNSSSTDVDQTDDDVADEHLSAEDEESVTDNASQDNPGDEGLIDEDVLDDIFDDSADDEMSGNETPGNESTGDDSPGNETDDNDNDEIDDGSADGDSGSVDDGAAADDEADDETATDEDSGSVDDTDDQEAEDPGQVPDDGQDSTGNNTGNTTDDDPAGNETDHDNPADNSSSENNSTDGNTTDDGSRTDTDDAAIISSNTSLTPTTTDDETTTYYLREDGTAQFTITSQAPQEITWSIDGVVQQVTNTQVATFNWTPGILWTPRAPDYGNKAISLVEGVAGNESVTWTVEVENVINPFFSDVNNGPDGTGPDTKVHVFTNNDVVEFTDMNVTISSSQGTVTYALTTNIDPQSNVTYSETDWSVYIPQTAPKDNYLTAISGFDSRSGTVLHYTLTTQRSHYYKTADDDDDDDRRGSSSGGGGSGAAADSVAPELIFLTLDRGVVDTNESITITLDAKNFNGGVSNVSALLRTPQGRRQAVDFTLVAGTTEYGTWEATVDNLVKGLYVVRSVDLVDGRTDETTTVDIENRTFYYVGDPLPIIDLELIYTIIDASTIDNGSTVRFTIDAADSDGVENVSAHFTSVRGEDFTVPLSLRSGNAFYGSWQGSFVANISDNTYTLEAVTLTDGNDVKNFTIDDRSVYVRTVKPSHGQLLQGATQLGLPGNSLTGSVIAAFTTQEGFEDLLEHPATPAVLGFTLLAVFAGAASLVVRKGELHE